MQFHQLKRREFMAGLGGAAVWPVAAWAQQPAVPVIGYLGSGGSREAAYLAPFRVGLAATGFVEGQNIAIEYRWAEDRYDRLSSLAAELVRHRVAVLVAPTNATALAAKAATSTIPIVFSTDYDPVKLGLVPSLNTPGGNITGGTSLSTELLPKRLELLRELLPTATIIAVLINPANPNAETQSRDLQAAARTLGVQLHIAHASGEGEFDAAFAAMAQMRAAGLVIGQDAFFADRSEQLAALALRHALPAIYQFRPFVEAGGLMSYGGSLAETRRLLGLYTGRILKGEKPADLPVQQSTKVELVLNMKTAKALSLTFPLTLLGRADEVIE
jgi:putative ABC transport system substrate-binding protein